MTGLPGINVKDVIILLGHPVQLSISLFISKYGPAIYLSITEFKICLYYSYSRGGKNEEEGRGGGGWGRKMLIYGDLYTDLTLAPTRVFRFNLESNILREILADGGSRNR